MSRVRILFLGTPDFAVEPLKTLAADEHFEIVKVFSQPDRPKGRNLQMQASPVKEMAVRLGLDVESVENINDPIVLEKIKNLRVDSAVVIAFGQILKQPFLDLFPYGVVNVHGSLLPRWRGAAPIQRALEAGDSVTGVTLQKIVLKLDAGPIIGVRKLSLTDDMMASEVYEKLKTLSCELLKIEFMDYVRGNLSPVQQDEEQVTIASKIEKSEGLINWNQSGRSIFNKMRAFAIWPGCWTTRDGKQLKILNAQYVENKKKQPGTVVEIQKNSFTVSCGEGALKILNVQPESKAAMTAEQYLLGYPLKLGETLGL